MSWRKKVNSTQYLTLFKNKDYKYASGSNWTLSSVFSPPLTNFDWRSHFRKRRPRSVMLSGSCAEKASKEQSSACPTNVCYLESHMNMETNFATFFSFQNEFLGESGWVKIDRYGDRTDFQLEIRKLNEEHTLEGTWSGANGLLWSGRKTQVRHQNNFAAGRPLVISTVLVLLALFFSLADV